MSKENICRSIAMKSFAEGWNRCSKEYAENKNNKIHTLLMCTKVDAEITPTTIKFSYELMEMFKTPHEIHDTKKT